MCGSQFNYLRPGPSRIPGLDFDHLSTYAQWAHQVVWFWIPILPHYPFSSLIHLCSHFHTRFVSNEIIGCVNDVGAPGRAPSFSSSPCQQESPLSECCFQHQPALKEESWSQHKYVEHLVKLSSGFKLTQGFECSDYTPRVPSSLISVQAGPRAVCNLIRVKCWDVHSLLFQCLCHSIGNLSFKKFRNETLCPPWSASTHGLWVCQLKVYWRCWAPPPHFCPCCSAPYCACSFHLVVAIASDRGSSFDIRIFNELQEPLCLCSE